MTSYVALQAYVSRLQDVQREVERNSSAGPEVWDATAGFLKRLQKRLLRPPRIAILGEANTGKTSLANLLIGQELLITDIVNNTRAPILIRYADAAHLCVVTPDGNRSALDVGNIGSLQGSAISFLELGLPLAVLQTFEVIDTPGVSIQGENLERLAAVGKQADLAIWCTLATQAWRASERQLWDMVNARIRTSSLLAVTHADALTPVEQDRVQERLQREAAPVFFDTAMIALSDQPTMEAGNGASGKEPAPVSAVDGGTIALRRKLGAALGHVEQRRLTAARRAVGRFTQGLDEFGSPQPPLEPLSAAS